MVHPSDMGPGIPSPLPPQDMGLWIPTPPPYMGCQIPIPSHLLVTSGGHHCIPVQTCSLENIPIQPPCHTGTDI